MQRKKARRNCEQCVGVEWVVGDDGRASRGFKGGRFLDCVRGCRKSEHCDVTCKKSTWAASMLVPIFTQKLPPYSLHS